MKTLSNLCILWFVCSLSWLMYSLFNGFSYWSLVSVVASFVFGLYAAIRSLDDITPRDDD